MGLQDVSIFNPIVEEQSPDQGCPSDQLFNIRHLAVAALVPTIVALVLALYILKISNERFANFVDSVIKFLEQVVALKQCLESLIQRFRGDSNTATAEPGIENPGPVNLTDSYLETRARRIRPNTEYV